MEHGSSVKLSGVLVEADYVTLGKRSTVRLTFKQDGKAYTLHDFAFRPYFFIIPSNAQISAEMLAKASVHEESEVLTPYLVEEQELSLRGVKTKAFKVYVDSTRLVPRLSELLSEFGERYEYDILFWKRYLIDKQLSPLYGVEVKAHEVGRVSAGR